MFPLKFLHAIKLMNILYASPFLLPIFPSECICVCVNLLYSVYFNPYLMSYKLQQLHCDFVLLAKLDARVNDSIDFNFFLRFSFVSYRFYFWSYFIAYKATPHSFPVCKTIFILRYFF